MTVEIRDPRLPNLIASDTIVEQVVTGFDFTEGPIWHQTEESLIFSDIIGNSLFRWSEQDGLVKIRRNSYMANGNTYDQQGRVVTCEHASSRVTRSDMAECDPITNAGLEVLATHYQGKQLNSPNDVVVKRDGMIYFTDPPFGRNATYGIPRSPELSFQGVYRLDPVSKALTLLADHLETPNGLCFSQDETRLFVNDTMRLNIHTFDVQADGTVANGRIWAETTGAGAGRPDGMKIDQEENLYCCGPGGIHVFDCNANCLGVILMPEHTTNMVFGDSDLCTLYITASTSIYKVRVKVPGWATLSG